MRLISVGMCVCVVAWSASGCAVAGSEGQRVPVRYVVFADASLSITPRQADIWCADADALVFSKLTYGDSVAVYPLSDHTGEAAPRTWSIDALDEDSGMEETARARGSLETAVREGRDAACGIMRSPARSRKTLILPALTRIPQDAGRETRLIFLTDALESGDDLDLERTALNDSNVITLATAAVHHERLQPDALHQMQVQFVLDSPPIGSKQGLNPRWRLESFWRPVIEAVGGTLTRFDSGTGVNARVVLNERSE